MSHWGSNYKSLWHLKILEIFRNYLEEQEELQGELLSFLHCADPKSIKIRPLSFKALRSEAEVWEEHFHLAQWWKFTEQNGNGSKLHSAFEGATYLWKEKRLLFSQIQLWAHQLLGGRSSYLYSSTIWPIQQVCFPLNDDIKDLNEWLLLHYMGMKLRMKKIKGKTCMFSGSKLDEYSLCL